MPREPITVHYGDLITVCYGVVIALPYGDLITVCYGGLITVLDYGQLVALVRVDKYLILIDFIYIYKLFIIYINLS